MPNEQREHQSAAGLFIHDLDALPKLLTATVIQVQPPDLDGLYIPHTAGGFSPDVVTLEVTTIVATFAGGQVATFPVTYPGSGYRWTVDGTPSLTGDQSAQLGTGPVSFSLAGASTSTIEVTETVIERIWAARKDFSARDFVQHSATDSLVTLTDSRFTVRVDPNSPWAALDEFRDDRDNTGAKWIVQGVSEWGGRERFRELLARRAT